MRYSSSRSRVYPSNGNYSVHDAVYKRQAWRNQKKKKKRALTRTWEFQRLTCYHAISAAIQKFVPQKEDIKKMLL